MSVIEIVQPRDVALGDPAGLKVRRTLPTRQRSLIGGWCFLDHYGPDDVSASTGMRVRPHPHTGLQTVSWLFTGEVEHRDSAGHHAMVRPGEVNLMTAGRGISHSEMSTDAVPTLHGAQLWVALPDADRFTAPAFEHAAPELIADGGLQARVFVGSWLGSHCPVRTFSPLLGAELRLAAGTTIDLPLDAAFEHGLLVDSGHVRLDGQVLPPADLAAMPPGRASARVEAITDAHLLLLGGEPLGEQIVMWWNFIGRTHEEIVDFAEQWQAEVDGRAAGAQFGMPVHDPHPPLPSPALPTMRLRSRG